MEAWSKLQKVYKGKDPARKVHLFKQFVRFKFQHGEKYAPQINQFYSLVDDLKDVEVKIPEELLSIFLLCSLPPELENFVVAIESRDVLPTLDVLKNKILEEEQRRMEKCESVNEQVFGLRNKQTKFYKKKPNVNEDADKFKNVKCYKCGRRGHIRAECKFQSSKEHTAMCIVNATMLHVSPHNWIVVLHPTVVEINVCLLA